MSRTTTPASTLVSSKPATRSVRSSNGHSWIDFGAVEQQLGGLQFRAGGRLRVAGSAAIGRRVPPRCRFHLVSALGDHPPVDLPNGNQHCGQVRSSVIATTVRKSATRAVREDEGWHED